jgi:DNA-binding SARP family transcriptional activator/tetratricopeptide (TPR) repeat protein
MGSFRDVRSISAWASPTVPLPDPPLLVTLFGGPKLESQAQRVRLSPFQIALVALVAGHEGKELTRSMILAYFWAEGEEAQLRRRLSQLIYSLQMKLAPFSLLHTHGDRVCLADGSVASDLGRFLHHFEERRLLPAAALLTRGFLVELEDYPTAEFESWAQGLDRKLRSDLKRLAKDILEMAESEAAWNRAAEAAASLLLLDPSDESSLRSCVRAECLAGGRASTLSPIGRIHARIQAVIPGRVPESITVGLSTALPASHFPDEPGFDDSGLQTATDPPFVGRGQEFERLSQFLKVLPTRQALVLGIVGDPGVGKSRLGHEVVAFARLSDFRVVTFECNEFEQDLPLAALNKTFERLRGKTLPRRHVRISSPELWEGFFRQLQKDGAEQPLLLFFDDLQWADPASLALLEFVYRRWDTGTLIILAAIRSPIPGQDASHGQRWLMSRTDAARLVNLPELDAKAVQALLEGVLGRALSRDALDESRRLAGGVPALLLALAPSDLDPPFEPFDAPWPPPDPNKPEARRVLDERTEGLSPSARAVLELLAVSSQPLTSDVGAEILQTQRGLWWKGLGELEARLLLTWVDGRATLRHGLVRRHVIAQMPEGRWRQLNQAVAERFSRSQAIAAGDLALHFHNGEGGRVGREAACVAALQAEQTGASSEALRYSELVVGLSISQAEKLAAKIDFALRLSRYGHLHRAVEELARTVPEAHAAGMEAEALQCELCLMSCGLQLGQIDPRMVLETVESIAVKTIESRSWVIAGEAFDLLLKVLDARDDVIGIRRTLKRVRLLLPRVDSIAGQVRFNAILAVACFYESPEQGLGCARRAVALANASDCSDEERLQALNRLLVCLISQGTLLSEEGQRTVSRARALAECSGDLLLRCYPVANQSAWKLDIGDPQGALETLQPVIHYFAHRAGPEGHLRVLGNRGLAWLHLGNFDEALRDLTMAESLMTPLTGSQIRRQLHAGIGLSLLQLGRIKAAQARAEMIRPIPKQWVVDPTVVIGFLSTLLCRLGRPGEGLEILSATARNIRRRFPLHWINLVLMQAKLKKRLGLCLPLDLLAEATSKAEKLRLTKASWDLRQLGS